MMKLILIVLLLFSPLANTSSCFGPQKIIQKPLSFDKKRIALTKEYQLTHYGINSLYIEPQMIVLHWTAQDSLDLTLTTFNKTILPMYRRDKLPGDLNVSSHFLVDRDGTIYQLMPENWMARHTIGLNHLALGIENVGGANDDIDDLTQEQVKANAFLICYLKKKYPKIRHVIGHNEYLKYYKTPLWLEKDLNYKTDKTDPGPTFVARVKKLMRNCPEECNQARHPESSRSS